MHSRAAFSTYSPNDETNIIYTCNLQTICFYTTFEQFDYEVDICVSLSVCVCFGIIVVLGDDNFFFFLYECLRFVEFIYSSPNRNFILVFVSFNFE